MNPAYDPWKTYDDQWGIDPSSAVDSTPVIDATTAPKKKVGLMGRFAQLPPEPFFALSSALLTPPSKGGGWGAGFAGWSDAMKGVQAEQDKKGLLAQRQQMMDYLRTQLSPKDFAMISFLPYDAQNEAISRMVNDHPTAFQEQQRSDTNTHWQGTHDLAVQALAETKRYHEQQSQAQQSEGDAPLISTPEELAALKSGSLFTAPDGSVHRKP